MSKKYKLTNETLELQGRTLHRIQALRGLFWSPIAKDFRVKPGDKGGFIEKEENLSHDGDCWVFNNAKVFENAEITGDACVCHYAIVNGNAKILGDVRVVHEAMITYNAKVSGKCYIGGCTIIGGNATVKDSAFILGDVTVYGNAVLSDNVYVCGNTVLCGDYNYSKGVIVGGEFNYKFHCDDEGSEQVTNIKDYSGDGVACRNQFIVGDYKITPIEKKL